MKTTTNGEGSDRHRPHEQLPSIAPPRLPYHPAIEQRFGVDKAAWKALVEAIFPNATSTESVILALSYCRARKLDPFKRNVHIVPIWNKELRRYIDTIWPGIGELRTTAFRTSEYAGRDDAAFGIDETRTFTGQAGSKGNKYDVEKTVTFPQWAQVTVYRIVKGQRVAFAGPRVYWLETYATLGHDNDVPNEMWETRPRGQIEKCAEAAALRAAFPEEVGGDYIPEEVQHATTPVIDGTAKPSKEQLDALTDRLLGANGEMAADREVPDEPAATDAGERPQTAEEPDAALLDDLQAALAGAYEQLSVSLVNKVEEEYRTKAGNEATRTAVSGLCAELKAKIKAAKPGTQKSLAGT
jgi:phage recombination protein Bet